MAWAKRRRPDHLHPPQADRAAFRATGDPEALRSISRLALREHLDRHSSHAVYVNTLAPVSAPAATPAFFEAAERVQAQWYTLLNRSFGCGNVRRLRRATDLATVCLALSGTLLADGQVYLPGCWPIHTPKSSYPKKTPFGTPMVPPEFLGLGMPNTKLEMAGGNGRVNPADSGIQPSE